MPTSIIENTTWAAVSGAQRKNPLRVRPYWLARPRGVLVAAEVTLLAVAVIESLAGMSFQVPVLIAACSVFFHARTLDRSIVGSDRARFWSDVLAGMAFGLAASVVIFRIFPGFGTDMSPALLGAALSGLLPVAMRPILRRLVANKKLVERILIVGSGELAGKLHRALTDGTAYLSLGSHSEVVGFPDPDQMIDASRLHEMVEREKITRIIVAEKDSQSRTRLAATLLDLRLRGLQVNEAVDFYEKLSQKIWVEASSSEWFVYADGFNGSQAGRLLKRTLDVACASLLLLVTAPLLALIAALIKLESKGPVLFRQERVGLHGSTFTIFKFRSMRVDAENESGPAWAKASDNRVTRVGRILRHFRLDEIPQAFNVLGGEMSLVGPRPERPYFVDRLAQEIPFYSLRHYVKPGITGWAQVMYPYGASIEDAYQKLQYDIYYAKHRSIGCDLRILLRTVKIVLFGRGY